MKQEGQDLIKKRIISLIIAAIAIFLSLALISYSASDPCLSNYAHVESIKNWMGILGAYVADVLFALFGIGAFFIPIFFIEYIYRYLAGLRRVRLLNAFSSLIIFFVFIIFLGVFFEEVKIYGVSRMAGGALGTIIGKGLSTYLNPWGSLVLLITLLSAALIVGYDLPRAYTAIKDLISDLSQRKVTADAPSIEGAQVTQTRKDTKKGININNHKRGKPAPEKTRLPLQTKLGFLGDYNLPPLSYLRASESRGKSVTSKELKATASLITSKLKDFGVDGEILDITPGPIITMYEFRPAPGIKINRIVALADDLAMALKATPVRVVAPIPGKNAVGIEIPNRSRETVYLRKIIASSEFITATSSLTLALGTDIQGAPVVADLARMPHLLIAGATGTGKSVGLNAMILSLLYRCSPSVLKFIIIDPKRIELSHYDGIPHLLYPVVTDTKEALAVFKWAISEIEMRYKLFKTLGVKIIDTYNKKVEKTNKDAPTILATTMKDDAQLGILPKIVIVVDEMADLMMVSREIEEYIARLAQIARAAGIYMIVATQRPSVDVITGLIKANFPARISFRVSSKIDSRTILDGSGAEQLLAQGDMLFLSPGSPYLRRIHGALVSEEEVDSVVEFIREQKNPDYVKDINEHIKRISKEDNDLTQPQEYDPMYDQALEFVVNNGSASISLIQRHLRIGYNRAARIIEQMEKEGIVGPADVAGKPRKVLIKPYPEGMDE
ncbi:MAG: DNA translocase FtsK 4TM domain-containing protein [Thermodesulfobacteriota bacterium]|nr:DNA translocase FtsK 4TM domain-containing protein [Thermodesulfobacteriota bacterium]